LKDRLEDELDEKIIVWQNDSLSPLKVLSPATPSHCFCERSFNATNPWCLPSVGFDPHFQLDITVAGVITCGS
jgi:hypothetical protein